MGSGRNITGQLWYLLGQTVGRTELALIVRDFYTLDNDFIKDVDHHLYADAVGLMQLAYRAGKRQIIVTNRPHGIDRGNASPRNMVRNSVMRECIDDILCGDDYEFRKPHRRFLESRFGSGLESLGEIIVIGDQFIDAELAFNVGAQAILVIRADKIAHLDQLGDYEAYTRIVPSLGSIEVEQ